jgi:hypothetical protein
VLRVDIPDRGEHFEDVLVLFGRGWLAAQRLLQQAALEEQPFYCAVPPFQFLLAPAIRNVWENLRRCAHGFFLPDSAFVGMVRVRSVLVDADEVIDPAHQRCGCSQARFPAPSGLL